MLCDAYYVIPQGSSIPEVVKSSGVGRTVMRISKPFDREQTGRQHTVCVISCNVFCITSDCLWFASIWSGKLLRHALSIFGNTVRDFDVELHLLFRFVRELGERVARGVR
jgi:hypothetical protein